MDQDRPKRPMNPAVRQGLRVSALSAVWTVAAGSGAIAIGVIGNTLTLAVVGVIGLLDAVGSATLLFHFKHAIRHESISARREKATLLVVSAGLAAVGLATIGDSAYRLDRHTRSTPALAGIILAGLSIVISAGLAVRKRRIAGRIPSRALNADGWLSATGAVLAFVTVLGTTLDRAFAWWWSDPVAAVTVASGAIALSIQQMFSSGTFGLFDEDSASCP